VDLPNWVGLAATTFIAALLYAVSGSGFAVLAAPLFLLFADPAQAIQLVIILSTALSLVVIPGLWRSIAPGLLLRLTLPVGLFAFHHADPIMVRGLAGTIILVFAALMAVLRRRLGRPWAPLAMSRGRDVVAGAISGIATALVGMAGPPVLIYLLLGGAPPPTVRATPPHILFSILCSNAGSPCRDDRRPRLDLARGRNADPVCGYRRPCRPAAR
jgi:uncharacterized membrane protein YfcA